MHAIRNDLTQNELDVIAGYMDDDIREQLHAELAPCLPATFLTAYLERDPSIEAVLDQEFAGVWAQGETLHLVTADTDPSTPYEVLYGQAPRAYRTAEAAAKRCDALNADAVLDGWGQIYRVEEIAVEDLAAHVGDYTEIGQ